MYSDYLTINKSESGIDRGQSSLVEYCKWKRRAFVANHHSLVSCPALDSAGNCQVIVHKPSSGANAKDLKDEFCGVECKCGVKFCFNCQSSENHAPIRCSILKDFYMKGDDFLQQILSLDKFQPCPKVSYTLYFIS